MRVERLISQGHDATEQIEFANFLHLLGEGRLTPIQLLGIDYIQIPSDMCIAATENIEENIQLITDATFPNFLLQFSNPSYLLERTILSSRNLDADAINSFMLQRLPGDMVIMHSVDSIVDDQSGNLSAVYPTEFLNTLTPSGLPHHTLKLKVGMPVILLRNLQPSIGLCNGVRMMVRQISRRFVTCEIAVGAHRGRVVQIPRISLITTDADYPIKFKRRQFPILPAFAMTINKAQGQTFGFVGLYLQNAVFTHGQLYVAISRVSKRSDIRILTKFDTFLNLFVARNVVYQEVLL
jgi:ATP-dependent DNA helicase PIF1